MAYLFIFLILFFCSDGYCDKTIFYDPVSKKEIYDISGRKSKEQIEREFGVSNVQAKRLRDGEAYRIVNNTLVVFDHEKETDDYWKNKAKEDKKKIEALKQKLNLTDDEINFLLGR